MPDFKPDFHRYAWDYFQYHAAQRLIAFRFYLIMCALILAGYASIVKERTVAPVGILLALVLPVVSFFFWKLDERNRQLIHHAEDALRDIEGQFPAGVPVLRIFRCEEAKTSSRATRTKWERLAKEPLQYSTCFHFLFALMASLGIACVVYSTVLCFREKPQGHMLARVADSVKALERRADVRERAERVRHLKSHKAVTDLAERVKQLADRISAREVSVRVPPANRRQNPRPATPPSSPPPTTPTPGPGRPTTCGKLGSP